MQVPKPDSASCRVYRPQGGERRTLGPTRDTGRNQLGLSCGDTVLQGGIPFFGHPWLPWVLKDLICPQVPTCHPIGGSSHVLLAVWRTLRLAHSLVSSLKCASFTACKDVPCASTPRLLRQMATTGCLEQWKFIFTALDVKSLTSGLCSASHPSLRDRGFPASSIFQGFQVARTFEHTAPALVSA